LWQELYTELRPHGLEIVTVALDTGGITAARPWIEAASPMHPSLVDEAHVVGELFGVTNVPSGVWIDEDGMIVRPPETSYPRRPDFLDAPIPDDLTPERRERVEVVRKLRIDAELYVEALRDWVREGARSRYALSPDEVIRRSRPRPVAEAEAAAYFELGKHLHLAGRREDAVRCFREAYRRQPDNWTYKRQAWNLLLPGESPLEVYGGDWMTDVRRTGAENYYPPLDM